MSLNLHALANTAIQTVNANETVTLYQSNGQKNIGGIVSQVYEAPQKVTAQVQSEGTQSLAHMDKANQADFIRRFYLMADTTLKPPSALIRQLARSGDIIKRADNTYFLITSVIDDFSAQSNWVCVLGELQTIEPDFSTQEWFTL